MIWIIILLVIIIAAFIVYWGCNDSVIIKVDKSQIANIKTAMDLAGLPIITFYNGNKKYHFLMDTGSNCSYLDVNTDIPKRYLDAKEEIFYGSAGIPQTAKKAEIDLYFNEKQYTTVMKVSDFSEAYSKMKEITGVTLSGILGTDFLDAYKYCIDFKEMVIYVRK